MFPFDFPVYLFSYYSHSAVRRMRNYELMVTIVTDFIHCVREGQLFIATSTGWVPLYPLELHLKARVGTAAQIDIQKVQWLQWIGKWATPP